MANLLLRCSGCYGLNIKRSGKIMDYVKSGLQNSNFDRSSHEYLVMLLDVVAKSALVIPSNAEFKSKFSCYEDTVATQVEMYSYIAKDMCRRIGNYHESNGDSLENRVVEDLGTIVKNAHLQMALEGPSTSISGNGAPLFMAYFGEIIHLHNAESENDVFNRLMLANSASKRIKKHFSSKDSDSSYDAKNQGIYAQIESNLLLQWDGAIDAYASFKDPALW